MEKESAGVSGEGRCLQPLVFTVEDEEDVARLIAYTLQAAGFGIRNFVSGNSVIKEGLRQSPALFLLDVMLPATDGFELCRQIRQTRPLSTTPIIFLTARAGEEDRIKGLELGADDYIIKPFSPRELVARIRALLRIAERNIAAREVIRLSGLEIDVSSMTIHVQGHEIRASTREFQLLRYLATHNGQVLTRDRLLNAIWSEDPSVTPRCVDVYIRRLREKIEKDPRNPCYLKTLHGVGYRFDVPST